ncbi:hypothetical protein M405DRAFT_824341 [Rhizopogon salebrosus TDB-379]|nr:hypothetical protein M405DRAFT_824341 [Rhizopogon salebrosus TDB-379]
MARTSDRTKYIFSISSLPDRFLILIFQALVDDMYCSNDELRLDCFTLSSVCCRWRSLVVNTPQFWTRLHMVIRPRALSSTRLETCLKRSSNALVDVVIYLPCPPNSQIIYPLSGPPIFPRTTACLKVLQSCKIICPSSLGLVTFVEESFRLLSSTCTPSLRKLTLKGCHSKILPQQFVVSSSLTHLSLDFFREYGDPKNRLVPSKLPPTLPSWDREGYRSRDMYYFACYLQGVLDTQPLGQLSKRDDSNIHVENSFVIFHNLLSTTRNLTFLEVYRRVFCAEHTETSGELDPVILPVLRTLIIFMDAEKPAYLGSIFAAIAAPNLLHLAVYGNSLEWDESSLVDFSSPALFNSHDQTPKFPSVCKLTMKNMLQSMHGPGKNARSIFTAFPHMTDVVLDQDIREIAIHLALESYDRNMPSPWPCLRQLTIEMSSMTKFHYIQPLLEWLHLRRASGLPLPAVVIRYELRGPRLNDARDLTVAKRIVNDVTGYRASDTRDVGRQLAKLGASVDLRITNEGFPPSKIYPMKSEAQHRYHIWAYKYGYNPQCLWEHMAV